MADTIKTKHVTKPGPAWTVSEVRDSDCTLSPLFALLLGVPADSPRIVKPKEAAR